MFIAAISDLNVMVRKPVLGIRNQRLQTGGRLTCLIGTVKQGLTEASDWNTWRPENLSNKICPWKHGLS